MVDLNMNERVVETVKKPSKLMPKESERIAHDHIMVA
jgi:hypothetical protein